MSEQIIGHVGNEPKFKVGDKVRSKKEPPSRGVTTKNRFSMGMIKFLDNMLSIIIYTVMFIVILLYAEPALTGQQIIGYSLILGFFASLINNIERVLRGLFKK